MKYIRTKYGTIEINKEEIEREIVNEADTIEELCDEFIVERPQEHTRLFTFKDLKRHFDYYSQPYHKVKGRYGAIWTEKGLIYVAKMNEKGELELL